jgi:hypothetical protein
MQTLPPTDRKHLSHDAALMLLAVLPDHIRTAYLNHAEQIGYSIELVLEMALADFLDSDSLTFADCKPQIGLPLGENQRAAPSSFSNPVRHLAGS